MAELKPGCICSSTLSGSAIKRLQKTVTNCKGAQQKKKKRTCKKKKKVNKHILNMHGINEKQENYIISQFKATMYMKMTTCQGILINCK